MPSSARSGIREFPMNIVYALLIGLMVFCFAGVVQADDVDYSGSYSCSGEPQQGCGECTEIDIYPPSGVVVTKVSGDSYQICPQYNNDALGIRANEDCITVTIQDGVVHWNGTVTGPDVTFNGEVTANFDGTTIRAEETGKVTGKCNCDLKLTAVCTK